MSDPLLNILYADAKKLLKDDYVHDRTLQDKKLEQIKEKYNFDVIKDVFDNRTILPRLEYFFGGDKNNFVQACNFLSLDVDNNKFVPFLWQTEVKI